jgi:hypothetical protein
VITHAGESAEQRFMAATGALPTARASAGDCLIDGCPVEVKQAAGGALNQVRPVKYLPVAFLCGEWWYVVPAHEICRLAARHVRGQHTENAFESCALRTADLGEFRIPTEGDLLEATRGAIAQADRYVELKRAMAQIASESRWLADRHKERVGFALRSAPQDVPLRPFQAPGLFDG